ncbi:phospholipase A2 [Lasiosphaeria miniovina]|uniref:Putative phospholipase n=1 Tax=Lasiosphaeria miniovina TaxID=1954250 RepID=A0AA40B6B0_9PEZI|nr:phospholipase A2 [Lasiosphaeria miniovina]KAK0728364.1 phospholipase A2 [Lasiosphaeria miniovina]
MASLLSRLSPVPTFPDYAGPYKVGTVDIEIPVSELDSPSPKPKGAADIHTVQFRIYYPAVPESNGKPIAWLPAPQRLHVAAYAQFLGIKPVVASLLSFLPRYLHYVTIPVHSGATLLSPPKEQPAQTGWPTVVFSHGLGGNRNTYSYLMCSLASHGAVVMCPEHRDGSAAVSLIRDPNNPNSRQVVPYVRIPHAQTNEVWEARDRQLRIRLWELGLGLEALLAIDRGEERIVKANLNTSRSGASLLQFAGMLDVQEPGKIIFAGHSFGAATMVQLLKSSYYADLPEVAAMRDPLFVPKTDSAIRRQVTEQSLSILLDMWCFPILSASSSALYKLPLPTYSDTGSAVGGAGVLAIESDSFFKWKEHLHAMARILSPNPSEKVVSPAAFERPNSGVRLGEPNFFCALNSAHLSQSDFGILFPWLTKKAFGADNPDRILHLNLRALLQFLRTNGVSVAPTAAATNLEENDFDEAKQDLTDDSSDTRVDDDDDEAIFDRSESKGPVENWAWINVVGMGAESSPSELEMFPPEHGDHANSSKGVQAEDGDADKKMESEIDPSLELATGVTNES